MGVVVDLANVNQLEVLQKLLPGNEEDPVLLFLSAGVLVVQQLLVSRTNLVPEVQVVVTGPSLPLLVAPRIPQLDQSIRLIIYP